MQKNYLHFVFYIWIIECKMSRILCEQGTLLLNVPNAVEVFQRKGHCSSMQSPIVRNKLFCVTDVDLAQNIDHI